MNESIFTEVREETTPAAVNLLLANGWTILDIYKRKRDVRYSDPKEFEEYPVYILGNPSGG